MPDAITVTAVLFPIVQNLLSEGVLRGVDSVLRRTPARKAIRSTAEKFQTRASDLSEALERWCESESFLSEAENIGAGRPGTTDAQHVDLFISQSGLQLGAVTYELARDILIFFYTEFYSEMCASSDGSKVVGLQILAANQKLDRLLAQNAPLSDSVSELYSLRPELDTVQRALTREDREAEIQLDLIRQLVDRRQGRSALQLLTDLKPKVDSGAVSSPVRARFFINKGVCHLICGETDIALSEFEKARLLDPSNPKALINLAQVALLQTSYSQALELARQVQALSPKDVNAFAVQLLCLHELRLTDERDSLLSSNGWLLSEHSSLYTVAYIAFDDGRFEEAEQHLRHHNESNSNSAEAWTLLGSSILVPAQRQIRERAVAPNLIPAEIGVRIEEAEVCFSKAEQLLIACDSRRELAHTYANRGVSRMFLSKFDEGRRDFEKALDIDPSLDEARRNLGTLLSHVGKSEDAIRVFSEISDPAVRQTLTLPWAMAYLDASKPGEARRIVELALADSPNDSVFLIDLFLIACYRLRDLDACQTKLTELKAICDKEPEACRVLAQHWHRTGDIDSALATIKQAVEIAPEAKKPRYRLVLSEMLYRLAQYGEAADEYERVPIAVDTSDDTRRYVAALYAAGRLAKALQWTRAVRGKQHAIRDFSEIEALILERSGDLAAANVMRQALLADEITPSRQRLKLGGNLIRLGQDKEARSLIDLVCLEEVKDDPELLFEAARLRTILEMPDALKYAYRLLRIEFGNPEMHLFYTSTFFRREKIDDKLFCPHEISMDCTVLLRRGAEIQRYTVVAGDGDTVAGQIGEGHALTIVLMGRTVGEKFLYPENSTAEAEYEIQQVQSKYVFAFQDCLSHFNERFPEHAGLSRMEINADNPENILRILEAKRARSEKVFEMYRSISLPACTLARLFGRSDIELFRALVLDTSVRVLSSSGIAIELQLELQLVDAVTEVLVETSALVTLESLGLLSKLNERFALVQITQQTLDAIAESAINIQIEKQTGQMFSNGPGHIQMVEQNAAEMRAEKEFYERILSFLRAYAKKVAPVVGEALFEYERADLRATLGNAATSTIAAARASGVMVLCDDLALRFVAKNGGQKVNTFWTQTLLQDFKQKDLISKDEYHRAVAQLIELGFYFVSVGHADLVWAIRECAWVHSPRLRLVIATLAGPDCQLNDAVNIALDVLHEVWTDPVPQAKKTALLDLMIQVLVTGRNGSNVLRALSNRNATRSRIWTSATGEIQQSIQMWFIAQSHGLVQSYN